MRYANTRKWAGFTACLLALACLCACAYTPPNPTGGTGARTPEPISPIAMDTTGSYRRVALYFRFGDEPYLSTETRTVDTSLDVMIEQRVIEELLKGPSASHPELNTLFLPNVRVLKVEDKEGLLYVTLSREFLGVPHAAPADWKDNEEWRTEITRWRRLALESIVNSVTELGRYARVQLLIDMDNEGDQQPTRPERSLFYGDVREIDAIMLDRVERVDDSILTARNTARVLMNALSIGGWEQLYHFTASRDAAGAVKPPREEFTAHLGGLGKLSGYVIGDAAVSNDGQSATVTLSYTLASSEDKTSGEIIFPLKLLRESEIWKVTYPELKALLSR